MNTQPDTNLCDRCNAKPGEYIYEDRDLLVCTDCNEALIAEDAGRIVAIYGANEFTRPLTQETSR